MMIRKEVEVRQRQHLFREGPARASRTPYFKEHFWILFRRVIEQRRRYAFQVLIEERERKIDGDLLGPPGVDCTDEAQFPGKRGPR